jgi:general stress protein 26
MEQHEIDTELADASGLLDSTTAGHLAYVAKDGTPRVIPVGFYWTGQQFVVSTAETAPKVEALSVNPDVALTVDASGTPETTRSLSVRGRVDIRIVDGVVEEYFAAARKSMDPTAFEQFAESCRKMYDRMARIAITPQWARYYDYGTGRMPKFLQELAARNGL